MRSTDKEQSRFKRSPRYVNIGNQWYFKTREGDLLGPYSSVIQVHKAEKCFIELVAK